MLHTLLLLLFLAFINGEDDDLKNALNSIENRQRQLASSYYVLPNKDTEHGVRFDDDNLMYLDNNPPEYDIPHRGRIFHPAKSAPNLYEDDSNSEAEEYQRALNDRLLEQLMLDILKNEDDVPAPRPQKKSFFREREINEVSDSLQNLYPDANADEAYLPPSSFRERAKSKLRSPHRRLVKPPGLDEEEEEEYLNAINPLWKHYDGQSILGIDPEMLNSEDVEGFLKYLGNRDFQNSEELSPELYLSENKDRDTTKRYWLSGQPGSAKYSIQKRSTKDEGGIAKLDNAARKLNATVESARTNFTSTNSSQGTPKTEMKRDKKGQKEVPVDLKSFKPLNIKKKSIDWSNYFGVDKRQKKSNPVPKEHPKSDVLLDQFIQSYILQSVRNSAFNNRGSNYLKYFPKRNNYKDADLEDVNRRLENAEDLRTAEDLIIDHVLKFTGAHEGITDPDELQRFRERVIGELGAAYNLEKLRNEIFENSKPYPLEKRMTKQHLHTADKRVAIKKENAELLPSDLEKVKKKLNSSSEHSHHGVEKKNFNNKFHAKPGYETSEIPNNECPILNQIMESCLEISAGVKDRDNAFTPFCTLHYICNICGTKEDSLSCDLSFYSGGSAICGDEPLCRYTAQRVLYTLQSQKVKSSISASVCDPCIAQILQYSYTYE